jgi:mono/diheme cytochrome c family protein
MEVAMRLVVSFAALVTGALTLAACLPPGQQATSGASDFAQLCAPCHGPTGVGDGELAGDMEIKPADLTGLAARNGGAFPMARVMSKIWGYQEGHGSPSLMPKFEPLLESPTVLVDVGDGIQTPTPERLIDLADYLVSIQK